MHDLCIAVIYIPGLFLAALASYGLDQRVQDVTHDQGGILDVVCTRGDLPSPTVVVRDGGFSDHRLLRWVSPFQRSSPVYTTAQRRLWRSFCLDDLQTSALCDKRQYDHLDGDALAKLYDDTIAGLLDQQIPVAKSPVIKDRPPRGSTTSVAELSGRSGQWRGLLVVPVRCLTTTCRLPWRGASRDVSTSPCYSRSVLTYGRNVWTPSSHDRVDFGGRSMNCLVTAEHVIRH